MSESRSGADPVTSARSKPAAENAFARALDALEGAPKLAKSRYQTEVFRLATQELESDAGLRRLRAEAHRFDASGVFHGGPWEHGNRLVPELVRAGLLGEGQYPTLESLSELRMLAIAAGDAESESVTAEDARAFLRNTMGQCLDLLFGQGDTEAERARPRVHARARRLLALVREEISADGLLEEVLDEIEARAAQRPILVDVIRRLVQQSARIPDEIAEARRRRLEEFLAACGTPTELAANSGSLGAYREAIRAADRDVLEREARQFGELLRSTGLSNGWHAVLLRCLRHDVELLGIALGLSELGQAQLAQSHELATKLLGAAIHPVTCDSIYGFAGVLERSLLSHTDVAAGLAKLVDLDLSSEVRAKLVRPLPRSSGVTPNGVLVAGALAVLGQPLGVGQGNSPTCQAARALSLWSLHAPGYLLEHLVSASRDDTVVIPFEGENLSSLDFDGGLAKGVVDATLDPVSRILVPHLDRLYEEMMRRASLRGEDGHKWVNPALYGRWVPNGFTSIFEQGAGQVTRYEEFVRLFYATHHPAYADHAELIYPNPVGVIITDVHGRFLGYHAVSIQRVASDPDGELRVYFFNPNNEGRQRWGHGVAPTVADHGETPGESSLPFEHFVAHLYAFHFNPYEIGDGYAVPAESVGSITEHAQSTWGTDFTWS